MRNSFISSIYIAVALVHKPRLHLLEGQPCPLADHLKAAPAVVLRALEVPLEDHLGLLWEEAGGRAFVLADDVLLL